MGDIDKVLADIQGDVMEYRDCEGLIETLSRLRNHNKLCETDIGYLQFALCEAISRRRHSTDIGEFTVESVNKSYKVDLDVIKFIADIRTHGDGGDDVKIYLFSGGYCYYFAKMLQDAFDGGKIFYIFSKDHCVWSKEGVLYDVNGVYSEAKQDGGDCVPFECLPEHMQNLLKHRKV